MIELTTTWNEDRLEKEIIQYLKIAEKYYGKNLLKYKLPPVKINTRLSSTLGRVCSKNDKVERIEFAEYLIKGYTDDFIIDVIGHETAHYIMFLIFGTSQKHNSNFKKLCSVFGVNGTATEKEHKKYMKEEYKKYLEDKGNQYNPKNTMKIRYVRACPETGCNVKDFKKIAKKDSIKKWVTNYYCMKHYCKLVVYDLKEKIKYYNCNNRLKKVKMTSEEIELYESILNLNNIK